jgi:molecular chaperone GrpE
LSEENPEEYHKGVLLILREFKTILKRYGLEEIEAEGKEFDPNYHYAVMTEEREDLPPNTVIQVLQKGYRLGEESLLRPAMVKVGINSAEDEGERGDASAQPAEAGGEAGRSEAQSSKNPESEEQTSDQTTEAGEPESKE